MGWTRLGTIATLGLFCAGSAADDLQPDSYTVSESSELVADAMGTNPAGVLANDSEEVSEVVEMVLEGPGDLTWQADGTFRYVPPPNFIGGVSISYEVAPIEARFIEEDAVWKYYYDPTGADPETAVPGFSAGWAGTAFDDEAWQDGTGLVGYGQLGLRTADTLLQRDSSLTAYFRYRFEVSKAATYDLRLDIMRDDGAIIYLDGTEIGRSPEFEGVDSHLLAAPAIGGAAEELLTENIGQVALSAEAHVLAISVHNATTSSSDFGLAVRALIGAREAAPSMALIHVVDGNRPPVIEADDGYVLLQNDTLDSRFFHSLYDNDRLHDPAGVPFDPILEVATDDMPGGQVLGVDPDTGHFTFTPDPAFYGSTGFTYRVRDDDGFSAPVPVSVRVMKTPGAPSSSSPDSYTTGQGISLDADVTANDQNAEFANLETSPAFGEIAIEGDGSFTYTPQPNFIGTDSFSYSTQNADPRFELPLYDKRWRYLHPLDGVDPASLDPSFDSSWYTGSFDDSTWTPAHGVMGYGTLGLLEAPGGELPIDTDIGTPPPGMRRTAYFRGAFGAVQGTHSLDVVLARDDAAIVYLNGVEGVRSYEAGAVAITSEPDRYGLMVEHPYSAITTGSEETMLHRERITGSIIEKGTNPIAISVHNAERSTGEARSSDLGLYVQSLEIVPRRSFADVTIEVQDRGVPPVLADDEHHIATNSIFDTSTSSWRSVFWNDRLFGPDGSAHDPIIGASNTPAVGGTLQSFDPASGHFVFLPDPGFTGRASFTYTVQDKDGVSEPAEVIIDVHDTAAAWKLRHFGPDAPDTISSMDADPDFDSLINLLEYAFGRDPLKKDSDRFELYDITVVDSRVGIEFEIPEPSPSDIEYEVILKGDLLPNPGRRIARKYRTSDWNPMENAAVDVRPNGRARVHASSEIDPEFNGERGFITIEITHSP